MKTSLVSAVNVVWPVTWWKWAINNVKTTFRVKISLIRTVATLNAMTRALLRYSERFAALATTASACLEHRATRTGYLCNEGWGEHSERLRQEPIELNTQLGDWGMQDQSQCSCLFCRLWKEWSQHLQKTQYSSTSGRAGLKGRGARGNFYWRTPMT